MHLPEQRFAIVHANLDVGGAEKQSVMLGALLRRAGAAVKVFSFDGPGPLSELCREAGLPWEVLGIEWGAHLLARRGREMAKLAWLLRRWRPTVLLPYCDAPNMFCGAIAPLTGARLCVWNQRGIDVYLQSSRLGQLVLRRSRCVISNSVYRASELVKNYGVSWSRIQIVPNAVSLPALEPDAAGFRRAHGIGPERFVCSMVANFVERKDHLVVLDAFARLHEAPPSRRPVLVLVGRKESYFETLAPRIAALQQRGAEVLVLDYQKDVSAIVAASDLALFSSTTEGLPNAVLEAMALARPVVAVDDASTLEALGESAWTKQFLVPPRDCGALAERIRWAIENPAILAEAGRLNAARAREQFSEQALLDRTIAAISPYLPGERSASSVR